MEKGAIILCGGKSTRMGRDKATLPFGPEQMLQRVIRLMGEVIEYKNIVVVASSEQVLPELPRQVIVERDQHKDRGPLEGLAAGLRGLSDRADAAYVTACDVPLLVPEFVTRMFALLGDHDVAVPRDGEFFHPLAAVYRVAVLPHVQALLAADRLGPRYLFEEVNARRVELDEMRSVDPQLLTLVNVNDPHDYQTALAAAGLA